MTGQKGWPYPGDSPLARARRVAQAYRAALAKADPHTCQHLDQQLTTWGETWAAPTAALHDLDDWLTPAQTAEMACVTLDALRMWRLRGRLTGRQRDDGTWEYQTRDVLQLLASTRRRA